MWDVASLFMIGPSRYSSMGVTDDTVAGAATLNDLSALNSPVSRVEEGEVGNSLQSHMVSIGG